MEDRHVIPGIRTIVKRVCIVAALAVILVPEAASAQGVVPGQRGGERAQLEQRIRARFGQIVRQRLGLSQEQARQLDRVVRGFHADRMRLAVDEATVREQVGKLLQQDEPSDSAARTLLDRMARLRERETHLAQQEEDSLLTVLSPAQVLRFNVLREEMGARIRRLRRGSGPMGRGPFGDGGRGRMPPGGGMVPPGGGMPPPGTMPGSGGSF